MFKKLLTSIILTLVAFGGFFGDVVIHQSNSIQGNIAYAIGGCPGDELPDEFGNCKSGAINTNDLAPNISKATIDQNKWYNELIEGLNAALGVLTLLVTPAIMLASWLLSPDWTSGDLFGLRDPMYKLWVTVSNILYFVYAIILLMIAIGTIFGNEKFSYKVMLPRLALGILMVPFSWWFVQWTISLSTLMTASVMTIPYETLAETQKENAFMNNKVIPTQISVESELKSTPSPKKCAQSGTPQTGEVACISLNEFIQKGGGAYGSLLVYAYNVFNIDKITELRAKNDPIKSVVGVFNQLIVGGLMFIIFGILVLALIFMLMVRAIKLWMYAIFSPLFTLHFVAGKELLGEKMDSFNLKEFIGLCFVPAVVGLTLSFGLIIISSITSVGTASGNGPCTSDQIKSTDGCKIASIMGISDNTITRKVDTSKNVTTTTVSIGGINLMFEGKITGGDNAESIASSTNSITGVLDTTGGVFGTLIVDMIALIFIWVAFMAAKGISKAVDVAVKPFEEMGNKIGSMAASAPKYMPLPIPGGSISGAGKAIGQMESIKEQYADKRYKESNLGQFMQNMDPSQKLSDELNAAAIKLKTATGEREVALGLKKVLEEATGKNIIYNRTIQSAIDNAISKKLDASQLMTGGFSSMHAKKMEEVIKSDLSTDEKRILLGAIAKNSNPASMSVGKSDVSKWKATLEGQGGGAGTTTSSGTGTANVFTKVGEKDNASISINIDGKAKGTINIKNPQAPEDKDVKDYLKKNITVDDLRKSLTSVGLTVEEQNRIINVMKNDLKES